MTTKTNVFESILEGIKDANISLEKKLAEIDFESQISEDKIKKAVEEAGYKFAGVEE